MPLERSVPTSSAQRHSRRSKIGRKCSRNRRTLARADPREHDPQNPIQHQHHAGDLVGHREVIDRHDDQPREEVRAAQRNQIGET